MQAKIITRENALALLQYVGNSWRARGKPADILEFWEANKTVSFDISYGCRIERYKTVENKAFPFDNPLAWILVGKNDYDLRACLRLIQVSMDRADFTFPPLMQFSTKELNYLYSALSIRLDIMNESRGCSGNRQTEKERDERILEHSTLLSRLAKEITARS